MCVRIETWVGKWVVVEYVECFCNDNNILWLAIYF